MTFAFLVITKQRAIPILDVFIFFMRMHTLSLWQLVDWAGQFPQGVCGLLFFLKQLYDA